MPVSGLLVIYTNINLQKVAKLILKLFVKDYNMAIQILLFKIESLRPRISICTIKAYI